MLKNPTRGHKQQNPYEGREGLVYVRVSSKKQELEGHGRESQEARCVKELSNIKISQYKTFSDTYTGGGDFMKRPAMRDLLSYVDRNPHKKFVVVFDDLKRLARDTEFHLKLRASLKIRDVVPICLNYKFDDTAEGRFVETILAAGGELERHQNKRQVVQKQKARLELGYWSFGNKRGYKMIKDSVHGTIGIPDTKDSFLLKQALEGFANGEFVKKIDACRFLVENGFWKRKNPEKYVYLFTRLLKDSFYAGYIEYEPWEISRRVGKHQPIISMETFEINQRRLGLGTLSKKPRKDVSNDFPLRGLLSCGECNGHLCASWSKGNGGKYGFYFCQNKKCHMFRKSINKDTVHTQFDSLLKNNQLKSEVSDLVEVVFDKVWTEEVKTFKENHRKAKENIKTLETKVADLTNMIISTKSETLRRVYESQLETLGVELEELKEEGVPEVDLNFPYQTALGKSKQFLKSPYSIWQSVDTYEKQRLFFFLFEEKLPYSKIEGYQTNKVPNAIRLFEDFVSVNTNDVDRTGLEPATPSLQMMCSTR